MVWSWWPLLRYLISWNGDISTLKHIRPQDEGCERKRYISLTFWSGCHRLYLSKFDCHLPIDWSQCRLLDFAVSVWAQTPSLIARPKRSVNRRPTQRKGDPVTDRSNRRVSKRMVMAVCDGSGGHRKNVVSKLNWVGFVYLEVTVLSFKKP